MTPPATILDPNPQLTPLGVKRLQRIKEMIHELGYNIPMTEEEARSIPRVGGGTIRELIRIGWVTEFPLRSLSTRAVNCLSNAGIKTKEQARQAIIDGRLTPHKTPFNYNSSNEDRGIRNYGWKSHKEVCKWAGLPEPQKQTRRQICPHCGKDALCSPNP